MKCRSMSITMSVYLFNGINGHFFYRSAIISETEREGIRMSEQKAYLLLANGQVLKVRLWRNRYNHEKLYLPQE